MSLSSGKNERSCSVDDFLEWLRSRFAIPVERISFRLIPSGKKRIRAFSGDEDLAISSVVVGVYVAKKTPFGYVLSVEGAQLFGPLAKKNVLTLNRELLHMWMLGEDVEPSQAGLDRGIVLLRYNNLFVGCGYFDGKVIKNFLSIGRRIER